MIKLPYKTYNNLFTSPVERLIILSFLFKYPKPNTQVHVRHLVTLLGVFYILNSIL